MTHHQCTPGLTRSLDLPEYEGNIEDGPDRYTVTPRLGGERVSFPVSGEDLDKIERGGPWEAVVVDLDTGAKIALKGAPCDLPGCYCDAEVVSVELD